MSGPSDTAVQAAEANIGWLDHETPNVRMALEAAHDPALGLDRSVCLRDVYDALNLAYHPQNPSHAHPADLIEQRFGSAAP